MALLMLFSGKRHAKIKNEAIRRGFEYYQTDNIYLFLKYAGEAKPEVVMMDFEEDFNCDEGLMNELYSRLCDNHVCPRIFLNRSVDFDGEIFFQNADFEKENMQKYLN